MTRSPLKSPSPSKAPVSPLEKISGSTSHGSICHANHSPVASGAHCLCQSQASERVGWALPPHTVCCSPLSPLPFMLLSSWPEPGRVLYKQPIVLKGAGQAGRCVRWEFGTKASKQQRKKNHCMFWEGEKLQHGVEGEGWRRGSEGWGCFLWPVGIAKLRSQVYLQG